MQALAIIAGAAVLALLAAMGWQHQRYLSIRRDIVEDRQGLFHGSRVFHVATLARLAPGANALESVRKLRDQLESGGQAQVVYAGRVVATALSSAQLPDEDWDVVVLTEYPSRGGYDAIAKSDAYRAALADFAATYDHGMQRSAALNLALPQILLGARAIDILKRAPSPDFSPAESLTEVAHQRSRDRASVLERADELREYGERAVVVFNLLKVGTPEQRKADAAYGRRMMSMFAENAHGPMHMGRAVTVSGDADFDRMALVYYPGIDYFVAMGQSRFFNGIVGDKQPGDTLAMPTVPLLGHL